MEISELFYSIQGEGKRSGIPSFFIRTNFCNLRCKFPSGNLCDTPYTSWSPSNPDNRGSMSIEEIAKEYSVINSRDVVITGGEPAMQLELAELCRTLRQINNNIYITLETNGTITGEFTRHIDLASISPKLSSSIPRGTNHEEMHLKNMSNAEAFESYANLRNIGEIDIQWKFVFTSEEDLPEIREFCKRYRIVAGDVYLMPEGVTPGEIASRREEAVRACLEYGYNYTDRLHILIWGSKRGV